MDSCAYAIAYNVIYKRLASVAEDSVKKEIKKINIVKETKL